VRARLIAVAIAFAACGHHAAPIEQQGGDRRPAAPGPLVEVARALLDEHDRFEDFPEDLLPRARAGADDADTRALLDLLAMPTLAQEPGETLEMFALRQDLAGVQRRIQFLDGVLARDDEPALAPLRADLLRMRSDLAAAASEVERRLDKLRRTP